VRFGFNHEAVNNNQSLGAINPRASDGTLASFSGRNAAQVLISAFHLCPVASVDSRLIYTIGIPSRFMMMRSSIEASTPIKFGVAVERMLLQATALTDPSGIWQFGALSEFDPAGNFVQSTFLQNIPRGFKANCQHTFTP